MHDDGAGPQYVPAGISRREALKRGVVLGGAALWTVPAVQVLSITEAAAQQPSGLPPEPGPRKAGPNGATRGRWF